MAENWHLNTESAVHMNSYIIREIDYRHQGFAGAVHGTGQCSIYEAPTIHVECEFRFDRSFDHQ